MVYTGLIFIIIGILTLIILYREFYKKEGSWVLYLMTATGLLYMEVFVWLIIITEPKEKSHLEYLRGNLEVRYEKTYIDSVLIRTDTVIEFKKK